MEADRTKPGKTQRKQTYSDDTGATTDELKLDDTRVVTDEVQPDKLQTSDTDASADERQTNDSHGKQRHGVSTISNMPQFKFSGTGDNGRNKPGDNRTKTNYYSHTIQYTSANEAEIKPTTKDSSVCQSTRYTARTTNQLQGATLERAQHRLVEGGHGR